MNQGRKLISGLLVLVLTISLALSASATDIQDMKDKEQQLEDQRNEAASEKTSLATRVKELSESMKQAETQLEEKRAEIETAEQDLLMARIDESEQYESMKLRIRYMYENGNVNFVDVFLESESIADFFNKAEYIKKMSEYDRKKLDEFQMTVHAVEEKELVLQAEYDKLEALQDSLAAQRTEAESLLAAKTSELAEIQADLADIQKQIDNAETEAKKQQEKKEADKEQPVSNSGNSNSSQNTSGGSSSAQAKPPVVSGNGYFTHPCPGMSYQSSYFGEIRESIGDYTPHKGHDYAAPAGTPIYAAAAGTVMIAGYSTSAGYWVVINHGNGLVSKYMHMYQRPLVSEGQKVSKGQHIGGVGTTGQSTGNHLHFQVEVNGVAVNPSNYM